MSSSRIELKIDGYRPLRDIVFEGLREAIVSGRLAPGERLMEVQLAEEMGVSRTPVREAIRKLELEGFVIIMPRRGAYVADLSVREIAEVFEIRIVLEELAAGLAAEHISEEEIRTLDDLLGQVGARIERNDFAGVVEADAQFHDVLFSASRNSRLSQMVSTLREQIHRYRSKSLSYPGRMKGAFDEHRRILEAIKSRDPEAAREAAREHITSAEANLMESLDREGR